MDIKWLNIDGIPCGCALWRSDYQRWIDEAPLERNQFSNMPTRTISACPRCGWVEEVEQQASQCDRGHSNPYYVRFGEHERAMVEHAATEWQKCYKKAP